MLSQSFFPNFGPGPFPKIAGKGPANFFGVGLSLFLVGLMGVLNSCFQNPSESSEV